MKVLSIGSCTLDQIGVVHRFAEPGSALEMPLFSMQGGGTAATAAVALVRWGATVSFVGKVGDDDRGNLIERTLSAEGVDTSGLIRVPGSISQTRFLVVESTTREVITYFTPGDVGPLKPEELGATALEGYDLVIVDGAYPQAQTRAVQEARGFQVPVLMDCSGGVGLGEECLSGVDVVVVSERMGTQITGVGTLRDICMEILERGPRIAIVTLGDEGAVGMSRDQALVTVDPLDVDVVDRTGAGDIFLGAIALGMCEGWSLEQMLWFANCAAGLSCKGVGSRSEIPSRIEVEEKMGR